MKRSKLSLAVAIVLLSSVTPVLAEGSWAAAYQDFDVVVVGGVGGHALTLAHHLARFHEALTQILRSPQRQLPTHIYELPPNMLKELIGGGTASYQFNGYETTVVCDPKNDLRPDDWGALFGYTGSYLFSSGGFARYPYWFLTGVPLVFANTEFQLTHVETGGLEFEYGSTVAASKLIPMRVFLRIQQSDPQLRSPTFNHMYSAESWYLAREVFVEGKLRSEFGDYLRLIQDGHSEAEAFSTSFKLSYEDLDKLLRKAMGDSAHLYIVKVPQEPADNAQARQLSGVELNARLADLSFNFGRYADAQRIALQVLQEDPANELALRTLAREKLREGDFAAALASVDRLAALPTLTAPALTDSGEVLSRLAREVSSGHATLAVDAPSLRARARAAFERAVNLDSDYLRAWAGLGYLYDSPAAAADAQALLPRAQAVMEKHSYSGPLARALATMCARTGQMKCASRFGEFWKSDAVSARDLDRATAFVSGLQAR